MYSTLISCDTRSVVCATAHVSEVEGIAARAERDVKVESTIKNFEEVWLSKLFDLTEYQRSYTTTRTEVCVILRLRDTVNQCMEPPKFSRQFLILINL